MTAKSTGGIRRCLFSMVEDGAGYWDGRRICTLMHFEKYIKMILVVDGRSSLIQIELSAKMSLDSN